MKRSGTRWSVYSRQVRAAHSVPVFMKKNRPAYQIQVLCAEEDIAVLEQVLFEETTTIGIRRAPMQRLPFFLAKSCRLRRCWSHASKAGRPAERRRAFVPRIRRRCERIARTQGDVSGSVSRSALFLRSRFFKLAFVKPSFVRWRVLSADIPSRRPFLRALLRQALQEGLSMGTGFLP